MLRRSRGWLESSLSDRFGLERIFGDPRYSDSLAIGLSALLCFDAAHTAVGVAELADELPLSRASAHRYASTLRAFGWLEQHGNRRKYRLAPPCAAPGMAVLGEIVLGTGCDPILRELREQTGFTASLGVLDGSRVTYVRRLHGHRRGQFDADRQLDAGAHVPAHCTALGKALLASLPGEELGDLLADVQLTRYGPATITGKRRLREELERVRCSGVAVSDREFGIVACSVAAAVSPLFRRRWLAVEINVPACALGPDRLLESLGPAVRGAARSMSGLVSVADGSPAPKAVAARQGESGKHLHT